MAFNLGAFCSDDDKYTDLEAWWDPYDGCEQFFTSTAAFKASKATLHGPRPAVGRSRVQVRGLPRAGFGTGGAGGVVCARVGEGPGPVPGRGAGSGGADGKKRMGKKKGKGNRRAPPQLPTQPPLPEILVLGSSLEVVETGHSQGAAPLPQRPPSPALTEPSLTESSNGEENWFLAGSLISEEDLCDGGYEGAGGRGSGGLFGGGGFGGASAPPAPCTSTGCGAAGDTSACGKKEVAEKKGKKMGKGNVQAPPPPPLTDLPEYASLFGLVRGSQDEYSEGDFVEGDYGFFDSNYADYMDCMRYDNYLESMGHEDSDFSDENSDENSDDFDDSDD